MLYLDVSLDILVFFQDANIHWKRPLGYQYPYRQQGPNYNAPATNAWNYPCAFNQQNLDNFNKTGNGEIGRAHV